MNLCDASIAVIVPHNDGFMEQATAACIRPSGHPGLHVALPNHGSGESAKWLHIHTLQVNSENRIAALSWALESEPPPEQSGMQPLRGVRASREASTR